MEGDLQFTWLATAMLPEEAGVAFPGSLKSEGTAKSIYSDSTVRLVNTTHYRGPRERDMQDNRTRSLWVCLSSKLKVPISPCPPSPTDHCSVVAC